MSEASPLIRDSIAALPISDQLPWHDGGKKGIVDADGLTIITGLCDYVIAPHRAHIALLASPHVAAAVADLLDALEWLPSVPGTATDEEYLNDIRAARLALEAAITRGAAQ